MYDNYFLSLQNMTLARLRFIIRQENRISQRIEELEHMLSSAKSSPKTLNTIIHERDRALRIYNAAVRQKEKTAIEHAQRRLFGILNKEVTATRRDELKRLKIQRKNLRQTGHQLIREYKKKESYWDFSE